MSRLIVAAAALVAPACVTDTRPILSERPPVSGSKMHLAGPPLTVAVIETRVEFLDASAGVATSPEGLGREGSAALTVRLAQERLRTLGFQVVDEHPLLQSDALAPVLNPIHQRAGELARARPGKRLDSPAVDESVALVDAVLVQALTVNVGRSGIFSLFFGSVRPSTNSSRLRASMIDLRGPVVIWGRDVFFRDLPTEDALMEAAVLLYEGLSRAVGQEVSR